MPDMQKRSDVTLIGATALLILLPAVAFCQMAAMPMPQPYPQWVGSTGLPLAGAYLCSFAAGTTTPQATYTDSTATTPNTNPVVLNVNGQASVWVKQMAYKFILYVGGNGACPGTGAVQWSADNVWAIFSQVQQINSLTGAVTLAGTANEVNVVTAGQTITLSTPQPINTTASPTFNNLTLTGLLTMGGSTVIDASGNFLSPGTVQGNSFQTPTGTFVDSANNGTFHNLTFTGSCTGCPTGVSVQSLPTRAANTVYQNTNAGPLFVSISLNAPAQPGRWQAITDSSAVPTTIVSQGVTTSGASPTSNANVTFFVPAGNYYELATAGYYQVTLWTEWH